MMIWQSWPNCSIFMRTDQFISHLWTHIYHHRDLLYCPVQYHFIDKLKVLRHNVYLYVRAVHDQDQDGISVDVPDAALLARIPRAMRCML